MEKSIYERYAENAQAEILKKTVTLEGCIQSLKYNSKYFSEEYIDAQIDFVAKVFHLQYEEVRDALAGKEYWCLDSCFNRLIMKDEEQIQRVKAIDNANQKLKADFGPDITVHIASRNIAKNGGFYYVSARYGESDEFPTVEEAYKAAVVYLREAGNLW